MQAEIHILHTSDFYRIRDYHCNCTRCSITKPEYNSVFSFGFVRKGFFEYRVFRNNYEVHIGRALICKPSFEHVTRHIDNQPDICSVFDFTDTFYEALKNDYSKEAGWFFDNNDIHSVLVHTGAELEYLHQLILNKLFHQVNDHLFMDELVIRLVDKMMCTMGNVTVIKPIAETLKKFHLTTIERAKEFILRNFDRNISLQQLAEHCCVSVFHFSRIFKSIMAVSPYQYLIDIRLNHAHMLLQTGLAVTQVAFQCGFNSLEHFATAYRKKFNSTPSSSRHFDPAPFDRASLSPRETPLEH
jgi:AraC-like DNA-binding protein